MEVECMDYAAVCLEIKDEIQKFYQVFAHDC